MTWQDIILTAGQLVLMAALVPSFRSSDKPPVSTSVMMGVVLTTFGITLATIPLWVAGAATAALGLMWFALAAQKYLYDKQNNNERR